MNRILRGCPSEAFLQAVHNLVGELGGDYWQKRRVVAHMCGYEDAKFIVKEMYSTVGFSFAGSAPDSGAGCGNQLLTGADDGSGTMTNGFYIEAWPENPGIKVIWLRRVIRDRLFQAWRAFRVFDPSLFKELEDEMMGAEL